MTDDQQVPPQEPPAATPIEPTPAEPPPKVEYPTSFGQQVAAKGGLPDDLQTRSAEIERITRDASGRIRERDSESSPDL